MENNIPQMADFESRRKKRMAQKQKKRKIILLVLAALLVLVVGIPMLRGGGLSPEESVTVTIPQGSNTGEIAAILKEHGVISNRLLFMLSAKTSEYGDKLRYGTFQFDGSMDQKEILKTLTQEGAKRATVRITIPEGYSVERIVKKCVEEGISNEAEFEEALLAEYDFEFLSEIPQKEGQKYRLQGFLFPSTYEFYQDATAEEVIKTLLGEFEKQYRTVSDDFSDVYTVITKASLVERESKLDSENATIAGVINNRLKKGMRLQIDASVVYAITDGQYDASRVLNRDLEVDSPYNTYKNNGLPVGPICNPGIEAIRGVLNPENHKYLFYHTDEEKKDGSHIFTENFDDHRATMN